MEANTIDVAINVCNDKINVHKANANKFLTIIIGLSLLFIASQSVRIYFDSVKTNNINYSINQSEKFKNRLNDFRHNYRIPQTKRDSIRMEEELKEFSSNIESSNKSVTKIKELLSKPTNNYDELIIYGIFILIFSN